MRPSVVLTEVGQGLRRNIGLTVAVVLTVLVAGVLGGMSLLLHDQVDTMKDYWYGKVEVSIFLCSAQSGVATCGGQAVTEAERNQIRSDLTALPQVEKVYYESQAEAYQHFQQQFKNNKDIVNSIPPDSLPESFRVKLRDPSKYSVVASAFTGRPGVEEVQDERAIFEPLFRALNGFQFSSLLISGLMVACALLLIANTVRVAAFTRRRETGIMRLVGASNLAIRVPFVLETMISALVGAGLAIVGLVLFKVVLIDHILAPSFRFTNFIGWGAVVGAAAWVTVVALAMAAVASTLTLRRYLRV